MSFLADIHILSHIKRYSTIYTIRQESVAEHSFHVAAILFDIHQEYKFDLGRAIQMAIVHDMPEIHLNDIPRIIKKKYPKIADAFEECEEEVIKDFPHSVRNALEEYMEGRSVEYYMVKLADIIQCKQYAWTEVRLGNHGYLNSVHEIAVHREKEFKLKLKEYKR